MLTWHFVTSATFDAGVAQDDHLYFLSDTKDIYRGSNLYSGAFQIVDDTDDEFDTALALITRPSHGVIYLSKTTMAGKIYDGAAWQQVIYPVSAAVTQSDTNPVSGGAVYTYVQEQIESITSGTGFVKNIVYSKENHTLTITGGEGAPSIELEGLGVSINYDAGTGALTLVDMKGATLGSAVNLDLERFVSAAAYDSNKKEIILAFTDVTSIDTGASYTYPDTMPEGTDGKACRAGGTWYIYSGSAWTAIDEDDVPLTIGVGDLVDTYTANSTATLELTVVGNAFSGNVKLDSVTGGNQIVANANGLYVAPVDLSNYMTLVGSATENNLATFTATGSVKDSGKAIGGAALAGTPNANTLATEAAVNTAITAAQAALTAAINGKIAKATGATEDNVATFTADGQVQDSGVAIGGATLAGEVNATTLATEAAVKAAITAEVADVLRDGDVDTVLTDAATNDKVPTSKAVVNALTWSTTM